MHYQVEKAGKFLLVRWAHTSSVQDIRAVVASVEEHHRTLGQKIHYVSLHDILESEFPPADTRDAIVKSVPRILASCETCHFVLPNTDTVSELKRATLRAMMSIRKNQNIIFIHSSMSSAYSKLKELCTPVEYPIVLQTIREWVGT